MIGSQHWLAAAILLGLSRIELTLSVCTVAALVAVVLLTLAWRRSRRRENRQQQFMAEVDDRHSLASLVSNDGYWEWDLVTKETYYSSRWVAMLGIDQKEVVERIEFWIERVHPDDREQLEAALSAHLEDYTSRFQGVHRVRHQNGTYRWMLSQALCLRDSDGQPERVAGIIRDITEQRITDEQLTHDAFHDQLTGLPNRALFLDRLGGAIARSQRHPGYLYSILFMDLDRFKTINDSYGHAVGDLLLKALAERVSSSLRPVDTVARLSGDEFAILLDDISQLENATELATRVLEQISRPFDLDGNEVFTSASIGIATSKTGYTRPEDALRDADTAMYRAKNLGKARHQVFDTSMHARAMKRIMLETKLRKAEESEQLILHYQPIVSLEDESIVGLEALLRWRHPKRGLVPLKDFLPLAEETGLIVSIGRWALTEACKQLVASSLRHTSVPISVNFSSRQVVHVDLLDQIETVLEETGLSPERLRLDITEDTLLTSDDAVAELLAALAQQGISVDLDGFGAGYSSLTVLLRQPISRLKTDRRLVGRMMSDEHCMSLVQATLALANSMGLEVVAKGVETPAQADKLRKLGCQLAQGYLFSEPVESSELDRLLS
jgi:diguanylate cyclase (GGDEF)-like protein/PAS domain S-box-containing protein